MKLRRRYGLLMAGLVGACNAITGAHDRVLDEGDSEPVRPRSDDGGKTPVTDAGGGADTADVDGGGFVFQAVFTNKADWISPNGGTAELAADGGIIITAQNATVSKNHPVIVPSTQPTLPSDDYTVTALYAIAGEGEFGLVTRIQADGSAVIFGSKFGINKPYSPFLGTLGPPEWNPSAPAGSRGDPYTIVVGQDYILEVKAAGALIHGRLYRADEVRPEVPARFTTTYLTGGALGFYVYVNSGDQGIPKATLKSLKVTVP